MPRFHMNFQKRDVMRDTVQPLEMTLRIWQQLMMPEHILIVQAASIQPNETTLPPIGMGYNYVYQRGKMRECQIGMHEHTVLCAFSPKTDKRRRGHTMLNREIFLKTLESNSISNKVLSPSEYFTNLPTYKFVISPEGNGIDCHRHYEALMAGCIPIIEYNPIIVSKYGNAPILWTRDYSEINEEYLLAQYEKMLDMKWDFSHLLSNYWPVNEQRLIKQRGNYWCYKLTGMIWYMDH